MLRLAWSRRLPTPAPRTQLPRLARVQISRLPRRPAALLHNPRLATSLSSKISATNVPEPAEPSLAPTPNPPSSEDPLADLARTLESLCNVPEPVEPLLPRPVKQLTVESLREAIRLGDAAEAQRCCASLLERQWDLKLDSEDAASSFGHDDVKLREASANLVSDAYATLVSNRVKRSAVMTQELALAFAHAGWVERIEHLLLRSEEPELPPNERDSLLLIADARSGAAPSSKVVQDLQRLIPPRDDIPWPPLVASAYWEVLAMLVQRQDCIECARMMQIMGAPRPADERTEEISMRAAALSKYTADSFQRAVRDERVYDAKQIIDWLLSRHKGDDLDAADVERYFALLRIHRGRKGQSEKDSSPLEKTARLVNDTYNKLRIPRTASLMREVALACAKAGRLDDVVRLLENCNDLAHESNPLLLIARANSSTPSADVIKDLEDLLATETRSWLSMNAYNEVLAMTVRRSDRDAYSRVLGIAILHAIHRSARTYTIMIEATAPYDVREAWRLLDEARQNRLSLYAPAYNFILRALVSRQRRAEIQALMDEMDRVQVQPTATTYAILLSSYDPTEPFGKDDPQSAIETYAAMRKSMIPENEEVLKALARAIRSVVISPNPRLHPLIKMLRRTHQEAVYMSLEEGYLLINEPGLAWQVGEAFLHVRAGQESRPPLSPDWAVVHLRALFAAGRGARLARTFNALERAGANLTLEVYSAALDLCLESTGEWAREATRTVFDRMRAGGASTAPRRATLERIVKWAESFRSPPLKAADVETYREAVADHRRREVEGRTAPGRGLLGRRRLRPIDEHGARAPIHQKVGARSQRSAPQQPKLVDSSRARDDEGGTQLLDLCEQRRTWVPAER
ncbi:hypothetical protein BDK51DRAFT_44246 [Blyttiomyces helicus]|uniref:Pentacotripeptide-repeat region of PRORP domain-containing protein n=1 Tax=Blyttiomyces helicus TaxID=388810 RepID=A0A4P9WRD8_9FUNG|nr:hypothetical protein BDK51DRAFT_44246 [Blyttiomyces helicus]|eukprot:RKO93820.1 hypothetical protein BDK51DRAFT_44246 [Blyttiomyces helicus]